MKPSTSSTQKIKDCIDLSKTTMKLSISQNIFQFVMQGLLYIICIANYEYLTSNSQLYLIDQIIAIPNGCMFLQEKFMKIVNLVHRKTQTEDAGNTEALFKGNKVPEKSHYNLIKILFNNLLFY